MDKNKKDMPVSDNAVILPDDVQRLIDQRVAYLVGKKKRRPKELSWKPKRMMGRKEWKHVLQNWQ